MKVSFNVLNRNWIPVRTKEGTMELLGIRQTLSRAHELLEISVSSPMEEYGLYRFFCVFLMDALRPETEIDIEEMLDMGQFDMERIERYIEQCNEGGECFDVFDESKPFLQSKYDSSIDKEIKPVSVLDYTMPSGNNHTHFDHRKVEMLCLDPEKATRLLIAAQLFCTAGAQGYPSGVNASPPFFGVIKGDTLFETLVFTLMPLDAINIPFDIPPVLWRSDDGVRPKAQIAQTSWLRGMLFPSRRICLITQKGNETITGVYFCQGENFVNKETWRDPFVTYRSTTKGIVPLRPARYRPIWQNLNDIIDVPGNHASRLLKQYLSIRETDDVSIMLYGVETNQASYLSICRYDLSFPSKLSSDPDYIELLTLGISASEKLGASIGKGLSGITTVTKSVSDKISVQHYYKQCEIRFWQYCNEIIEAQQKRRDLYLMWCEDVSTYAKNTFIQAVSSMRLRASALEQAAKEYEKLLLAIKNLKKEASQI